MDRTLSGPPAYPVAASSAGWGRRLFTFLVVAVILAGSSLLLLARMQAAGGPARYVREADFVVVLTGGAVIAAGHGSLLYNDAIQEHYRAELLRPVGLASTQLLPFNHVPQEALVVAPFLRAGVDPVLLFAAWTALNVLAILGALAVLSRAWPLAPALGLRWLIVSLLFFPLLLSLLLGQDTGMMLLGSIACTTALRRKRDGWAGASCLLLTLKPPMIPVLLLALLVMRRWRALAAFAAASAAISLLAAPALGWLWPVHYLQFLARFAVSGPSPANPAHSQDWLALCELLFGQGRAAIIVAGGMSAVAIVAVGHVWWSRGRQAPEPGPADWNNRWAFTLIVALLANPHVLPHDLTLALVPGTLLFAHATQRHSRRLVVWLGIGWVAGAVAVIAPSMPPLPAVCWLSLTAAWLYAGCPRTRPISKGPSIPPVVAAVDAPPYQPPSHRRTNSSPIVP